MGSRVRNDTKHLEQFHHEENPKTFPEQGKLALRPLPGRSGIGVKRRFLALGLLRAAAISVMKRFRTKGRSKKLSI